jgi:hypothetical protein
MLAAAVVITGLLMIAFALAWFVFSRSRVERLMLAPVDLGDIALLLIGVVVMPLLYVALPVLVVSGLLGLAYVNALYTVVHTMVRPPWLAWLVAGLMVAAAAGAPGVLGEMSAVACLISDLVVAGVAIGIAATWVTGGLRARDATAVTVVLGIFDAIATWRFDLTADLVHRLSPLPLAPLLRWPIDADGGDWLGLGLGDLLIGLVLALSMYKAYGRRAGLVAAGSGLLAVVALIVLVAAGALNFADAFPAAVVLAFCAFPLYLYFRRRSFCERTMWDFRLGI